MWEKGANYATWCILGGNVVQIMPNLHNYASGADYAKWCISGGKIVRILLHN